MLNNNFIFKSAKTGWILPNKQTTQVAAFPNVSNVAGMGLFWKPDGLSFYIADNSMDRIIQFTVSVAWDVTSTMTYIGHYYISGYVNSSTAGLAFSNDGLKMFVTSYISQVVWTFNLNVAWDITSIASSSSVTLPGISTTRIDSISFTSDGLNVYTSSLSSSLIYQHKLSTPFDMTTATFFNSFAYSSPNAIFIKPDGTHIYIMWNYGIGDYKLNTKNDISTAVFLNSISVMSGDRTMGITFSPDGFNMYTVNSQYSQIFSAKLA